MSWPGQAFQVSNEVLEQIVEMAHRFHYRIENRTGLMSTRASGL